LCVVSGRIIQRNADENDEEKWQNQMAKTLNSSPFRADIRAFLEKQRDFVQAQILFAESKNTVLIAFNGAVLAGAFSIFVGMEEAKAWWYHYVLFPYTILAFLGCSLSLFYCFSAMYPKRHQFKMQEESTPNNKSPFMWLAIAERKDGIEHLRQVAGDLFGMEDYKAESNKCLEELHNASVQKLEGNWVFEMAIADQIVDLSQGARRKYRLFNKALHATTAGLLTPIALPIQKVFYSPDTFVPRITTQRVLRGMSRLDSLPKL
jgi:hypothetical protein